MKGVKLRKLNLKLYGHLYHRVIGFNMMTCAYCGDERYCLDHVPSISLVSGINIENYMKAGGTFKLYPVCKQCNTYLGKTIATSYYERLSHLSIKYDEKLGKMEVWTDYEISQMGPGMKSVIQAQQYKIETMRNKQSAVEEQITKILLKEINEDGVRDISSIAPE